MKSTRWLQNLREQSQVIPLQYWPGLSLWKITFYDLLAVQLRKCCLKCLFQTSFLKAWHKLQQKQLYQWKELEFLSKCGENHECALKFKVQIGLMKMDNQMSHFVIFPLSQKQCLLDTPTLLPPLSQSAALQHNFVLQEQDFLNCDSTSKYI